MIRSLVAGFGEQLAHELPALKTLGVQGIRTDCQQRDAATTRDRVVEIQAAGLLAFPIVSAISQLALIPKGTHVELLNEPDLNGPPARDYYVLVHEFAEACDERGLHLSAGGVSNLNERGIRYLRDAKADRWPASAAAVPHWYPHGDSQQTPHPGFASREAEVDALRKAIGAGRQWGIWEFGFHTANRATRIERLFGRKRQWSDTAVLSFVLQEWKFWQEHGAAGACLYQLNDGPTNTAIDRYGIRRQDGTWKPVASSFKGAA